MRNRAYIMYLRERDYMIAIMLLVRFSDNLNSVATMFICLLLTCLWTTELFETVRRVKAQMKIYPNTMSIITFESY